MKNIYLFDASHCVKSARIQSYSGPNFPAFGLNTERYFISLRIHFECGKMWTRITPNTDTFCAVSFIKIDLFLFKLAICKFLLVKFSKTEKEFLQKYFLTS